MPTRWSVAAFLTLPSEVEDPWKGSCARPVVWLRQHPSCGCLLQALQMVREARLGDLRAFLHVQRMALDLGNCPNLGVLT